jgi:hypothetical protein
MLALIIKIFYFRFISKYVLNEIRHFDWFILRIRHWCLSTHH